MDTRHLVDPEIAPLLELMPTRDLSAETLLAVRADSEQRYRQFGAPPIAADVRTFSGPEGELEVRLFDPKPGTTGRPALYHIHGGGMVLGSAEMMEFGPSSTAAALGIPVASIEYRLAPEHPFPAPQEDCFAGLQWLSDSADSLGIDPSRIGIIGESAGGGLAAATALMARDRGGPDLAAQFLIYPMLDHRTGSANCPYRNSSTGEFVWTRASNQFGWESLRGDYTTDDDRKGWFSPSLAAELTGLPPTWIGTGSLDLFFDEDLDYARRLVDVGVPVELHSYPGAIHAFNIVSESKIAGQFNRDLLGAIARVLEI